MQAQEKLIPLILTLIRGGDVDVLQQSHLLASACSAEHHQDVCAAASLLANIHAQYDFTESPAFAQAVASKSVAFTLMSSNRYKEPSMRERARAELLEAFRHLRESDAAFSLVPVKFHQQLSEARNALLQATRA